MSDASDDDARLAELLRQQERYIDHQLRRHEELLDQIEQLLSLAVALGGGGVALLRWTAGYAAAGRGWLDLTVVVAVTVGLASAFVAALVLLDLYIGLTARRAPRIEAGPDPGWVREIAGNRAWNLQHVRHAIIRGLDERVARNRVRPARLGRRRRASVLGLLVAVGTYGIAILMAWGPP